MLNTTIKPGEYCLGILGVENKTSKTGNPYTRVDFTTLKKPEDTNPRPHFPERFSVFYTHSSQFSMSDLKKICFICGVDGVENLQGKKLRGTIGFNGDFIRLKGLKPFEKIEIQPVDCPF